MIRLSCCQCSQSLEMDDAFAGGVCRCRRCGTIQAVPRNAPRMPLHEACEPADRRLVLAVAVAAIVTIVCAGLALAFLKGENASPAAPMGQADPVSLPPKVEKQARHPIDRYSAGRLPNNRTELGSARSATRDLINDQ